MRPTSRLFISTKADFLAEQANYTSLRPTCTRIWKVGCLIKETEGKGITLCTHQGPMASPQEQCGVLG